MRAIAGLLAYLTAIMIAVIMIINEQIRMRKNKKNDLSNNFHTE